MPTVIRIYGRDDFTLSFDESGFALKRNGVNLPRREVYPELLACIPEDQRLFAVCAIADIAISVLHDDSRSVAPAR